MELQARIRGGEGRGFGIGEVTLSSCCCGVGGRIIQYTIRGNKVLWK